MPWPFCEWVLFHLSCPSNTYSTFHDFFCIGSQKFWVFWVCCICIPRTSWCTKPGGSVRSVCSGGGVGGDVCNEFNRLIFIIIEEHKSVRGECGKRWSRAEGCGYVAGLPTHVFISFII
ncbi:unnamed protein product [Ectocarpus sp. 12 AP-2014]